MTFMVIGLLFIGAVIYGAGVLIHWLEEEDIKMEKLTYRKELTTESDERVRVATYANDNSIFLTLTDDEEDTASVTLTLKEAQRVKRYLEDAITTNIMNWEEE